MSPFSTACAAAFLPGKNTFAVNTHIARQWWMKPFLAMVDTFAMDPTKPMARVADQNSRAENA
jgi:acyl-[acyl-carrier-protein]-phospholipid O-acyltransferase/long-chain-fatty-acid--[acyl-carrier-protein] ligase